MRTGPEFDWRTFSGKMNEKQEKMKEKLAKKDLSITNLRSEIQRIQAKKDSQDGGLTSGQEMQVGRNEQRIEQLEEEIENLGAQPLLLSSNSPHAITLLLQLLPTRAAPEADRTARVRPSWHPLLFSAAEQFEESVMDGAVKRAGGDGPAQKRKKASERATGPRVTTHARQAVLHIHWS